jgi:hypothetical protein
MKESYLATNSPTFALHAPAWHAPCPSVGVVELAGRPFLWCPDCRCLVSMEAVAIKADVSATFMPAPTAPATEPIP